MDCISHTQLRLFFLSPPEGNDDGDGNDDDRDDTGTDADDSDSSSTSYSVSLKNSVHSVPGRSFRRSLFPPLLVRMIVVLVPVYFASLLLDDRLWLFLLPTTISSPEDKTAEAIKKILAAAAHPFQERMDVVIDVSLG